MTLFSIASNNIKKNFKNYWSFFLSSTFSVFVLYLFMSIVNNELVKKQLGSMQKFIVLFSVASSLIAFFSAFFIWYSNSFFVKARKKEFATYMLLGMSKKQVAGLNIIENFIITALAFIAGIILGLMFNKLFIMLLLQCINVSGSVKFGFSLKAIKYCFIVFGSVFVLTAVHSTTLIYKDSLIDLFNASKKAERGLKVSFITFIIGLSALFLLGYGYYLSCKKLAEHFTLAPAVILLVIAGSILFFTSTVSVLIHIKKSNERHLYSGTRLISTSQLNYRYKGNVGALSVIAITTTVALCAVLTCYGSFSQAEQNSRNLRPFSVEYINTGNPSDKIFDNILKKHSEVSLKYKDTIEIIRTDSKYPLSVISESTFDKVNSHENTGRKVGLISEDQSYLVQIGSGFAADTSVLNKLLSIKTGNKTYDVKVTGTDNKPFIALDHFNDTVVVKDSLFNEIKNSAPKDKVYTITGCIINNDMTGKSFTADIDKNMPKENSTLTFYDHFHEALQLLGMMLYIGLFIGMVFLMATGSIIYFKACTEAREDRNKYIILRKIGVSESEIKGAVSKELMLLFGAPLILAVINTFAAKKALEAMLNFKVGKEYIIVVIAYTLLYSIYYVVTLHSYTRAIKVQG